jgi:hypothetical protein
VRSSGTSRGSPIPLPRATGGKAHRVTGGLEVEADARVEAYLELLVREPPGELRSDHQLTPDGEVTDVRIATTRERFREVMGDRPRARVLIETSTESEWVARCLEELGHEIIVADPGFAPMYGMRTRRVKTDLRDARALAEAFRSGTYRVGGALPRTCLEDGAAGVAAERGGATPGRHREGRGACGEERPHGCVAPDGAEDRAGDGGVVPGGGDSGAGTQTCRDPLRDAPRRDAT